MRKLVLISFIFCLTGNLVAQNLPAFRQFTLNPFLFNPAFNAIDNYTEVSLVHRQQWLKVEDAPVASGIAAQFALHSRASLGVSVVTQESVALRNTLAKAIFAYKIPIAKDQTLSFGLTMGVGYNDLDLEGADYSNDPAILNAADQKAYADASFGLLYMFKGLKVGFALPRLFGQPYISPQKLDYKTLSQLLTQLYSISYKFEVAPDLISVEPYFLYRLARDNQNSWEAAALFHFKDKLWTGASFHSTQGVAFFLGMTINKFRFGYSYELPPANGEFASTSSHELQLNLRIGEQKILKRRPNYEN